MIRSLWIAASGMEAQQLSQDVVANNLANVNNVGFKKARADFQDLMYQIYTKAGAETSGGGQLPVGSIIRLASFDLSCEGAKPFGNFLPLIEHGMGQPGSNGSYLF